MPEAMTIGELTLAAEMAGMVLMPKLLKIGKFADYCDKTPVQTVHGWRHRGRLPSVKAGHEVLVRMDVVHRNIEQTGEMLFPVAPKPKKRVISPLSKSAPNKEGYVPN